MLDRPDLSATRSHPEHAKRRALLLPLVLALSALAAPAQLTPGTFLAVTASLSSADRGVFVVDRFAGTSQRLNISNVNFDTHFPARTFIEDENNFLLAVNTTAPLGHVLRVTYSAGTWRAAPLTDQGIPYALLEVVRIGNTIYMTRSLSITNATDGEIWTVPAAGGTPAVYVKIGPAIRGAPSAMVAADRVLHILMLDASLAHRGTHVSVNTTAASPAVVSRGLLPASKPNCRTGSISVLPRQACLDPTTGLIVMGGWFAEVLWRTPGGVDVRHEGIPPPISCPVPSTDIVFSLAVNTDTGAILVGDGDGGFEEKTCTQGSWKKNVQALPVAPQTRVTGIEYFASGSLCREDATSTGCRQSNGLVPCSYVNSLPMRGNMGFALMVETASSTGLLVLGARRLLLPLGPFGAPGCVLGPSPDVVVCGKAAPSGLEFTLAIPAGLPPGAVAYTQWAIPSNVNAFGLVTSETRVILP